jgi:tetratricopeptide (TPR) repeat protein
MRTPTLLAVTLLLTSCDRGAKDPPAAQAVAAAPTTPSTPPATPTATTPATPAVAAPAVAPTRPKLSAKERARAGFDASAASGNARTFREQLAAGRTAVKEKKYAEGILAFTAALKLDPNHAAALAELGWAAYLAGDLDAARRHTEQAIAGDASDRTRGAALYNLGRILEDRNDKDGAAAAYQRSLGLRPNEVVQKRLTDLTTAGADATGHDCDLESHPGRPPQDLCAALVAGMPVDDLYSRHECDAEATEPGEVVVDAAGTPAGGEPTTKIALEVAGGIKVAHFDIHHWLESGGSEDVTYLAVLYADRWFVTSLGSAYNPGVGYIGESFTVEAIEARDLVPGGRPELVLTLGHDRHDGDYGDNTTEGTSARMVAVLGLDGEAPRWLGAFKVSVVDETGPMLEGEPSEGPVTRSEHKVDHRFDAASGEVELIAAAGFEPVSAPGRFKLGALPAACPAALGYIAGG